MGNRMYATLDNYIDTSELDKLHYKICRGFSKARHLATIGNLDVSPTNILENSSYLHLCQAYQNYKMETDSSEIKIVSNDLDDNEMAVFLKFALGGYDMYQTYFIEPLKEYFIEVHQWIENLKDQKIFSKINESYFLTLDAGAIPFEHYHVDQGAVSEFLYIRPRLDRPFYIKDKHSQEKIYIDAKVAWWDDRVIHGGDPVMKPTYTLRIDGEFTDEFRRKVLDE